MPQVALKRDQNYNLVQDKYGERSFRAEYSGSNMIYAAFALPGSSEGTRVWQIRFMTYDGSNNLVSIKWPQLNSKASTDYAFSWTARATYTYS